MQKIGILERSVVVFSYPYKGIHKFTIETKYSKMDQIKFVEKLCSRNIT